MCSTPEKVKMSMKNMFKNQKGIIQIPLAIIVIAIIGVASVGAGVAFHQIQEKKIEQSLTANVSNIQPTTQDDAQMSVADVSVEETSEEKDQRVEESLSPNYSKADIDSWNQALSEVNTLIAAYESARGIGWYNQYDLERMLGILYQERTIASNILSRMNAGKPLLSKEINSVTEYNKLVGEGTALANKLSSQYKKAEAEFEAVSRATDETLRKIAQQNAQWEAEALAKKQADLAKAKETKAQTISFLNHLLLELRFLKEETESEIKYMDEILTILAGANDEAGTLLRQLTVLRRDRLINQRNALNPVIPTTEKLKIAIEKQSVSEFINAPSPEQRFANSIDTLNKFRAGFEEGAASYYRTLSSYAAILGQ